MHESLRERLPGLIASWPFVDDFHDKISNLPTSGVNGPSLRQFTNSWERPALAEMDATFAKLPFEIGMAASAHIPELDRVILIGGVGGFRSLQSIVAINTANGSFQLLATMPRALGSAVAVYSPQRKLVYVFGGYDADDFNVEFFQHPLSVDPRTGQVRTLTIQSPPLQQAQAVRDERTGKIVLMGGTDDNNQTSRTIFVFDPMTESMAPINGLLGPDRSQYTAIRSSANEKTYLFGGVAAGSLSNIIEELTVDTATGRAELRRLSVQLPIPGADLQAVEDPITKLIYLIGKTGLSPWIFDPITQQIWSSAIGYPMDENGNRPGRTFGHSVVFDRENRHALVMGGWTLPAFTYDENIWRVPVGTGAAVPLERWDFYRPFAAGTEISSIEGDNDRVVVGDRNGQGVRVLDGKLSPGSVIDPTSGLGLGSLGQVNTVAYNAATNSTWIGTESRGAFELRPGPAVAQYSPPILSTARINAIEPQARVFGTPQGLAVPGSSGAYGTLLPTDRIEGVTSLPGTNEVWSVSSATNGLPFSGLARTTRDALQNWTTSILPINDLTPQLTDIAFDDEQHLFMARRGGYEPGTHQPIAGILYAPDRNNPLATSPLVNRTGNDVRDLDVDAEGRIWAAVVGNPGSIGEFGTPSSSGGLTVYDATGGGIRTTEMDGFNAPIRDVTGYSSVSHVAAVDEKVWATQADGNIVTLAQRWNQLDENNNLDQQALDGVWTARGRTFFSSPQGVFVLQPDGITWDNRTNVHALAVLGDRRGTIWVGTETDVRQYTPSGWDLLSNRLGTRPSGPVRALAEDARGRIWLGGNAGLTLFDRNRFVFTLTPANSRLPHQRINSLLVDNRNQLWIGTNAGLVRWNLSGQEPMQVYTTTHGLPNNTVFDLQQLGTGEIAVSTQNGLAFFRDGTFQAQQPPIPAVNLPLAVDELGRLWAGSAVLTASGWNGYYWTNSGLRSSRVVDIATDGADRVWFVHGADRGASVRGAFLPPLRTELPIVSDVSPRFGKSGDVITITGSGLGNNAGELTVSFGGVFLPVQSVTGTQVVVRLTDQVQSGEISISRAGRRADFFPGDGNADFLAVPRITRFSPTGGNNGVMVTVYGTNFDKESRISLGNGTVRIAEYISPTELRTQIVPDDTNGALRVRNQGFQESIPATAQYSVTGPVDFRHINLTIERTLFNQGIASYGLFDGKPTLSQNYVIRDQDARDTATAVDELEIDVVRYRIQAADGSLKNVEFGTDHVTRLGKDNTLLTLPTPADLAQLSRSVNVTPIYFDKPGTNNVQVSLYRNGRLVAEKSTVVEVTPHRDVRVLLVPIMRQGYTANEVAQLQRSFMTESYQARTRLLPTGQIRLDWARGAIEYGNSLDLGSNDLSNTVRKLTLANRLDRIKSQWNNWNPTEDRAASVIGVVDDRILPPMPRTPGSAFAPQDLSDIERVLQLGAQVLNDIGCDVAKFANTVINAATFGLLGSQTTHCNITPVTGVGFVEGNAGGMSQHSGSLSKVLAHEVGHLLGLVGKGQLNYSANEAQVGQLGHSSNNEVRIYQALAQDDDPATVSPNFVPDRTLYRQPGVQGPVVNPLWSVTNAQLHPLLDAPNDQFQSARAKSLLSYAVGRDDGNSFLEPADLAALLGLDQLAVVRKLELLKPVTAAAPRSVAFDSTATWTGAAESATRSSATGSLPAAPPISERLLIAGRLNAGPLQGIIEHVSALPIDSAVSLPFDSPYSLVQLDAAGQVLSEVGILPALGTPEHTDEVDPHNHEFSWQYFSASLVRQPGVRRVQLRSGTAVLDEFLPGQTAPTLTVHTSFTTSYGNEIVPISWTANDSDGDEVNILVEFSADSGATWTPVAQHVGSGTVRVPAGLLPATSQGRFRVVASDGLRETVFTSPSVTVTSHAPIPWIDSADGNLVSLEGDLIHLSGGALDAEDGLVTESGLRWESDRDGELGIGSRIAVALSYGVHRITLKATDAAGNIGSYSITVTVEGSYLTDGVPDAIRLARRIDPLDVNAGSRLGTNGLSLRQELSLGLAPGAAAPAMVTPAIDRLTVSPTALELTADLSEMTPFPQQIVTVAAPRNVAWKVSADVDWLAAPRSEGRTLDAVNIVVIASQLSNGVHTGTLTFRSDELGQSVHVPVTVAVTYRTLRFDVNDDGLTGTADGQAIFLGLGLQAQDANYDVRLDVNLDGDVDALDLRLAREVIAPVTTVGDANRDCIVNSNDLVIWSDQLNASGFGLAADFDGNGHVGQEDFDLWFARRGSTCVPGERIGDLNHDGAVDALDAGLMFARWGQAGLGDINEDFIIDAADAGMMFANWTGDPHPVNLVPAVSPIQRSRAHAVRVRAIDADRVIADPEFAVEHFFPQFGIARSWKKVKAQRV